jgi:hypothetical protein
MLWQFQPSGGGSQPSSANGSDVSRGRQKNHPEQHGQADSFRSPSILTILTILTILLARVKLTETVNAFPDNPDCAGEYVNN